MAADYLKNDPFERDVEQVTAYQLGGMSKLMYRNQVCLANLSEGVDVQLHHPSSSPHGLNLASFIFFYRKTYFLLGILTYPSWQLCTLANFELVFGKDHNYVLSGSMRNNVPKNAYSLTVLKRQN
jgi:hypothetical protein